MAPTHSGATAPVRAQGPARYSVLEHGLARVGGPHARPELDAMTGSGSVTGWGPPACQLEVRRGAGRR